MIARCWSSKPCFLEPPTMWLTLRIHRISFNVLRFHYVLTTFYLYETAERILHFSFFVGDVSCASYSLSLFAAVVIEVTFDWRRRTSPRLAKSYCPKRWIRVYLKFRFISGDDIYEKRMKKRRERLARPKLTVKDNFHRNGLCNLRVSRSIIEREENHRLWYSRVVLWFKKKIAEMRGSPCLTSLISRYFPWPYRRIDQCAMYRFSSA